MNIPNQAISSDLGRQLVDLAKINDDKTLDPGEKSARLKAAGAVTLAKIDAQIDTLSFTSKKFAESIRGLIQSEHWAVLPQPKVIQHELKTLHSVAAAITEVMTMMVIDITEVMRTLLDKQMAAGLARSDERIADRTGMITSADAEFKAKEKANKEQLASDLVAAGMQIASAGIGIAGSAVSIGQMGAAAKKSASAYKMSKEIDGLDLKSRANDKTSNEIKGRISEADKKIEVLEQKALASPQNFSRSEAKELADLKKVRLDSEQELAELSDASNMGKRDIAKQRAEIERIDSDVKIMTQRAHAMQGLFSGIAQSVKGLGDLISSGLKFNASQTQVEADKRRLEKDLESSSEQASLDSYQQLRESLGKAVQMMSALEQTLSTSITSIIRTSV